jgi:hypothetical protein
MSPTEVGTGLAILGPDVDVAQTLEVLGKQ